MSQWNNSNEADVTQRNTMAVASLILGITSLVLSPVAVGVVFGVVALILGAISVRRPTRKGMAIAGVITGFLSIPASMVGALIVAAVLFTASAVKESQQREKVQDAISELDSALDRFEVDNGRYPTTAEGLAALTAAPGGLNMTWKGPYIKVISNDVWGNPWVYRFPDPDDAESFELFSKGPDGKEGTDDDIY